MQKGWYKKYFILMLTGSLMLLVVFNLKVVSEGAAWAFGMLKPFAYGLVFALLLNVPLKYIENGLFPKLSQNMPAWMNKNRRGVCLAALYATALLAVAGIIALFTPLLVSSFKALADAVPRAADNIKAWYTALVDRLGYEPTRTQEFQSAVSGIGEQLISMLRVMVPGVVNVTGAAAETLMNVLFGLVISIYFLADKESMAKGAKNSIHALMPEKWEAFVLHVGELINATFSLFLSGQLLDSFIITLVMLVVCGIMRLPYSALVAMVSGLGNIVPVFGPIISGTVCTVVIFLTDPYLALVFLIIYVAVQQVDGNFLYPRIVGSSLGIKGVWILLAVIVFGGLFGLLGILLGIPLTAVTCRVWGEFVDKRLAEKAAEGEGQGDI